MYACHVVIYLHYCYWLLTIDHCRHIGVNIYIEYMYIVWLYLCMLFMRLNFYTSRGCFTWHFVVMCEYPLSVCIYDWSHAEVDFCGHGSLFTECYAHVCWTCSWIFMHSHTLTPSGGPPYILHFNVGYCIVWVWECQYLEPCWCGFRFIGSVWRGYFVDSSCCKCNPLPHYVLFQAGERRQASWESCLDVVELCVCVCVWSDLDVRILLLLV